MRLIHLNPASAMFAIGFIATAACSDSTGSTNSIAGTYEATELTLTENGEDTDLLTAGAALTITLRPNGTTAGIFVVPGEYSESGLDETLDLAGSYSHDAAAGTVEFDHAADTFIRDVAWDVDDDRLTATFSAGVASLDVTLERES